MERSLLFAGFLVATTVSVLAMSSVAAAGGADPRVCSYGPARKADCARDAARMVARKVLQRKAAQPYLWQGPMRCTSTGGMLKWRCTFATSFPQLPANGYVAVTYRATGTGWHVYATVVAAP